MKLTKQLSAWQKQTNFGITIVLVIAVVAMLNFFANEIFFRFDLSQNKSYTLSTVSKNLGKNLDDVITIKAFISDNLPSQYFTAKQEALDLLNEYERYGRGKIKVLFLTPKTDQETAMAMQRQGIPQVQFNVTGNDKFEAVNGFFGITIAYGGDQEVIPVVQPGDNLEYQITTAIKKLTNKEGLKIGWLTSNQTLNTQNEVNTVYSELSKLYTITDVDLTKEKDVPAGLKSLIIAGPKLKFEAKELAAIKAYLGRGGSVLLLADGVKVDQGLVAATQDLGLNGLLNEYGLHLNQNLVMDSQQGIASFNSGFMVINLPYPYWPRISANGFDQKNPAVSKLENLVLPWVSSIDVTKEKLPANSTADLLVKSSNKAWLAADKPDLNPTNTIKPGKYAQYNLAVAVAGQGQNLFRLVVVGDSDFIKDNLLSVGDNATFFLNLVDSISLDGDLMAIRAKAAQSSPIDKTLSDGTKKTIRYANVFGITILVISFGIYRYYARRRKKTNELED
ncbi:MAG: GldG family protein [Candidatus Falkowbacteria bacterium]